jgi:hypothetical protein
LAILALTSGRGRATFCHSLTRLERHPIVGFIPATGHSIGEKERCSIGLYGRNVAATHPWASARSLRISNRPRLNADDQAHRQTPIGLYDQSVRVVAKTGEQNRVSKTIIGAVLIHWRGRPPDTPRNPSGTWYASVAA